MRGKSKGWTREQDQLILSGRKVDGITPQEAADRRYKLRRSAARMTSTLAGRLAVRLETLSQMNRLPKFVNSDFMKKLKRLATEIK